MLFSYIAVLNGQNRSLKWAIFNSHVSLLEGNPDFLMRLWGRPCWKWARYLASVVAMPSQKLMGQSSYWSTGSEINTSCHTRWSFNITIEHDHWNRELSYFSWWFAIVMLNYQRVHGSEISKSLHNTVIITGYEDAFSVPGCSWGSRLLLSTPSISRSSLS